MKLSKLNLSILIILIILILDQVVVLYQAQLSYWRGYPHFGCWLGPIHFIEKQWHGMGFEIR